MKRKNEMKLCGGGGVRKLGLERERFPEQRKLKLQPKGDGPFQVLEMVNDNAYKIDLPGKYA